MGVAFHMRTTGNLAGSYKSQDQVSGPNLCLARLSFKGLPVEATMLSNCANSQGGAPFLRLGEGKLFLVETEYGVKAADFITPSSPRTRKTPLRVQRCWLCDHCAEI
jgi:hypothetical protein